MNWDGRWGHNLVYSKQQHSISPPTIHTHRHAHGHSSKTEDQSLSALPSSPSRVYRPLPSFSCPYTVLACCKGVCWNRLWKILRHRWATLHLVIRKVLNIIEYKIYSLDIDWKNSPSTQSLGTRNGQYLEAGVQHKEMIRNTGKELCTRMFTEALFKIAEQAKKRKKKVGHKPNSPKQGMVK